MPKFEACSIIRKRLVTIWIFPYICFDFRCAGETQLTIEKCREKFKLWLDAFACDVFETRVLLKIFDAEFPYKLLFWATLPTRQDGSENREKVYSFCILQ